MLDLERGAAADLKQQGGAAAAAGGVLDTQRLAAAGQRRPDDRPPVREQARFGEAPASGRGVESSSTSHTQAWPAARNARSPAA